MQNTPATTATHRHDAACRASRRRHRGRDRHNEHVDTAIDMLDVDAIQTEQQIAAGARAGGGARVSAPRSRVKHVEVLGPESDG
jgi:hypothetical protein